MNKPANIAALDGLYDRLLDERLSAELASLIQANQASVSALPAEERSARLAEAFVKILVGILEGVEPDEAGTPREQASFTSKATDRCRCIGSSRRALPMELFRSFSVLRA